MALVYSLLVFVCLSVYRYVNCRMTDRCEILHGGQSYPPMCHFGGMGGWQKSKIVDIFETHLTVIIWNMVSRSVTCQP